MDQRGRHERVGDRERQGKENLRCFETGDIRSGQTRSGRDYCISSSAKKMVDDATLEIEKQKGIFQASLAQACRQTLEALKEKIEHKLFNPELSKMVAKPMQDPKLMAQLINAVIHALDKEGTKSDLSVVISSAISAKAVNELLASEVIQRLKEKGVLVSSMGGGIEVKLLNNNITIDLSDETIREMVAVYIRKDFREYLFRK